MQKEKSQNIESLKEDLAVVQDKIKKLEDVKDVTDRVAASFHLGMVGSGRNTRKLNKRKEAVLDKTIERAKILTRLYADERALETRIKDIEEGGPEKREAWKKRQLEISVGYWRSLKAGDTVTLFTGNEIRIKKKNKKSIVSENCTWTAAEIIGREAAKLL